MLTANAYPHNSVCGCVWSGGAMRACIPGVKGGGKTESDGYDAN